jgi:hypothetical protein
MPQLPLHYNVHDFGAIGDGAHEDSDGIQAALDRAAAVGSATVVLPPGTYKVSATIEIPTSVTLRGSGWNASTIRPSAGVTTCVVLGSRAEISDCGLEGRDTTANAVGLSCGRAALASNSFGRRLMITRFNAGGGTGILLHRAVSFTFVDCYVFANGTNVVTNGGDTPTDTLFLASRFREASGKGVAVETAVGLTFLKCTFEANREEGFYIANRGKTALDIVLDDCWFEDNWHRHAARHDHYSFNCDGAGSGTIRPILRGCRFDGDTREGTSLPRAIRLSQAIDFVLDGVRVSNQPGQVSVVDGSYGQATNWRSQAPFATTVSVAAGAECWESRTHIEALESAVRAGRDGAGVAVPPSAQVSGPGGTLDISNEAEMATAIVITNNGESAIVVLQGVNHTAAVTALSGPWSNVRGAAASLNVYWDAGSKAYRLQNNLGPRTFRVTRLGTGT